MAIRPLPPGFRFHPTDVELIKFYLKRKVMGRRIPFDVIAEVDIYKFAPWDLPDKSSLRTKDREWYFFVPRERKYANGARSNRATDFGYWKATGKDRAVLHNEKTAGMIKTLIFHEGRPPRGNRTDWVMYEFRLEDKDLAESGVPLDSYVLCKIFKKDGPGPKNGAQYGAPFNEEEWNDDAEVASDSLFPPLCQSGPATVQQDNPNIGSSLFVPGTIIGPSSSGSGPSKSVSPTNIPPLNGNDDNFLGLEPPLIPDDDFFSLLDIFFDDNNVLPDQNGENAQPDKVYENIAEGTPLLQSNDIYNGLHELNVLNGNEQNFASARGPDIVLGEMPPMDGSYLELNDFTVPLSTDGYGSHDVPAYASTSQHYSEGLCFCQLCNGYGFQHFPPATVSQLPQGFVGFEDHMNAPVSKETVVGNGYHGRDGYEANSGAAELGCTQEAQTRGEQRTNYSRLQNLLESIPARPASAAEHYAPAYGTKGREASSICFSPYVGSAIHVKVAQCGYTEHALSDVSEEYRCLIGYEPNQGREKLKKGMCAASQGSGFSFVCLLGTITALVWLILATVVINLGMYGLNVIQSQYVRACTDESGVLGN